MTKAAECSGMTSRRAMRRKSVLRSAMKPAGVTKVPTRAIEDISIYERSAVGDEPVVVEDDGPVMPVASPEWPSPAKPAKEADVEAQSERNSRSRKEQPRVRIPS